MVTVAGTHRRRGLLRRMLSESLDAARQRGDAVAILFAAEWAIYGRFGYAPASFAASYELDPGMRGASLPMVAAGGGTLRQVERGGARQVRTGDLRSGAAATGREHRPRAVLVGAHARLARTRADKVRGRIPTFILHTGAEGPDGYVGWVGNSTMDDNGSADIDVVHLCAATPQRLPRPVDVPHEPRPRRAHSPRLDARSTNRCDGCSVTAERFGRPIRRMASGCDVLDVPAAMSARRYAVADELTFDVVDDDVGGYAAGRFTLRADPDGAECVSSPDAAVELRIGQRALASCYLGGVSLRAQLDAGQVEEITPGAVDRADTMFGTAIAPWCATDF